MSPADAAPLLSRPEWPLLVALAVGLLIGLERERRKGEGASRSPAGLRTFALVGLLGGVAALIGNTGLILVAGSFVAIGALTAYALGDRKDPGLTGEVALVVTYVLGVLAQTRPAVALEAGVVVAALLAFRVQLHRFVRERITDQELLDALTLAIAAIVILPLLPNRAIDPFGLLNPFTLWRLAVVAMALNFLGYVAQRLLGGRYGLLVAGLAGGLVSSTAAVAAMGARSKDQPDLAAASAAGAVASMIGSLGYLAAIIGAVSPRLVVILAAPLGFSTVLMFIYAGLLVHRTPKPITKPEAVGRAFNGGAVLLFVALVGGFSLASELLIRWLGAPGALIGTAVMGLADAHAASVSMATLLAGGRLAVAAAALGVVLTLTTNMAVKIPTAFIAGSRSYGWHVTIGVGLLLAGLWLGGLLAVLTGATALDWVGPAH
ncbi:MgtC/SapB family protein [Caulobacter sp. DWP3-1-3b2]|uniref:MgtC/SapB family protein n=1 Tax=Caulobacter sp. DWP3-1-3b2 TaxID=2804643 RepID=UPI003CF069E8